VIAALNLNKQVQGTPPQIGTNLEKVDYDNDVILVDS